MARGQAACSNRRPFVAPVVRRRAVADDRARRRVAHFDLDAGRQTIDRNNLTACINRRRHGRRRKMSWHRPGRHRSGRLARDAVDGLRRGDLVAGVQRVHQRDRSEAELRRDRDVLGPVDVDGHRRMRHEAVDVDCDGALVGRLDVRRRQILARNRISLVDHDIVCAGVDRREKKKNDRRKYFNDPRERGAERHAYISRSILFQYYRI